MARLKVPCLVTLWNLIMVLCCLFGTGTSQGISCSRPTPPANAYIYTGVGRQLKEKYGLNEVVTFHCREGYRLSFVKCLTHGWSKTDLRCPPKNCSDPGAPANGRRQGDVFTFNSKVNFTCAVGYEVKGSAQRVCQENGTWSGTRTACEPKNCGDPGTPANGRRQGDVFTFNSKVNFTCAVGYEVKGSAQRVCQENGTWSGTETTCERILCRHPGDIAFGNNNGDKKFYRVGSTMNFWCFPGYDMEGNATISCTNKGKWSTSPPKCSGPSCAKPTPPDNAFIFSRRKQLKDEYQFNEVVKFRCEDGYYASGSSFWRCLASGWSNSSFRCFPKSCGDPGIPVNGIREGYVLTFKKKVSFKCNRGYMLVGPEYRQCQSNQTWSDRTPTCEPIDCGRLPPPRYGEKIEETSTSYLGKVVFECKKTGYELRGSAKRICQENGRWSGNKTTCEPSCRDPGVPTNGHRHDHSFSDSAIVRFSCRNGWNIEGSHTIRCNNGNWDHPTPRCLECGSPLGMESGKIPDGNIQASSTRLSYHAKDGRLNGRYAWCSGTARDPYLQIDFGKPYRVTALATQGSAYDNRWVERYTVTSNLAGSSFNMYRQDNADKIFIGNSDKGSITRNKLKNPVMARRIRIYPQKQGGFSALISACMRVEIYGCDLPSDCILARSRIVAKWSLNLRGGYRYYKAYLTRISSRYWKVELENENHGRPAHRYVPKYEDLPFVLDVPPKHEELQVGTRVLAPWGHTYYTSTIKTGRDRSNRYRVRADDGDEKDFTIDQIRLLKAPTFCN